MRAALLACLLGGCVVGGGPYAGWSTKSGLVYGGEIGAGPLIGQLALGMQNIDRFGYLRVDILGNSALHNPPRDFGLGGRFGIGYGSGNTRGRGGVFAAGANLGLELAEMSCSDAGTQALGGIELRYAAGEMQFVAIARVEQQQEFCIGN